MTTPAEALKHWHNPAEIFEALAKHGYAVVPIKPSEAMLAELAHIGDGPMISGEEVWGYMLASAAAHPNASSTGATDR